MPLKCHNMLIIYTEANFMEGFLEIFLRVGRCPSAECLVSMDGHEV